MSGDRAAADLGSRLHQARERRGLSLSQVAASTKIPLVILEALEKNDVAKLPGGLFGRAFVRSFAAEVGLDPDEAVEALAARAVSRLSPGSRPVSERLDDNEAFESNRQIAATFLRLAAVSVPLAALIVYFGSVGRRPQSGTAGAPGAAVVRGQPAERALVADAVNAAAARGPGPNPAEVAAPGEERVIVGVLATRACRFSTSVDGGPAVERNLEAGERFTVEMRRETTLSAADAGAVTLTFNGAEARPLGGPGESVTVHLNPGNIKDYLLIR